MKRNTIRRHVGPWGLMLALGASLLALSSLRAAAQTSVQPLQSLDPAYIQAAAEVDFYTKKVKFLTLLKAQMKGEIYKTNQYKKAVWPVLYASYLKRVAEYAKTRFLDYPFSVVNEKDYPSFVFHTEYTKDAILKDGGETLPYLRKMNAYISDLKQKVSTVTLTTLPAAELELENAKEKLEQITSPLIEPIDQPSPKP
jgi:hypothetical protein